MNSNVYSEVTVFEVYGFTKNAKIYLENVTFSTQIKKLIQYAIRVVTQLKLVLLAEKALNDMVKLSGGRK